MYPSHGGILDPLSQSLPPPPPHHTTHPNTLQPGFHSTHHPRTVGSTHLPHVPSISSPSNLSSKDRSNISSDETKNNIIHEKSKQSIKPSIESSSNQSGVLSTHPYGSRDGILSPLMPINADDPEHNAAHRTLSQFTAKVTSTTTVSSKLLSSVSTKELNQEETSVLSTSSSAVSATRLHSLTQVTSSHLVNTSSLVKTSLPSDSGNYNVYPDFFSVYIYFFVRYSNNYIKLQSR